MSKDTDLTYISLKKEWTPVEKLGTLREMKGGREAWLREYAAREGFRDLRLYRADLRRRGLTYYDILKESP